jgi:hypothetical protein
MADMGISVDNYSTHMGYDNIPNPVIEIKKNLNNDHKKELERSEKIISDLKDQIADMRNIHREDAIIAYDGSKSFVKSINR